MTIVKVAIPMPLRQLFDYLPPKNYSSQSIVLQKGVRVQVPFGKRQVMGFVISTSNHTELPLERLKPITTILDKSPLLSPVLMQLLEWVSRYYHYSLGETILTALPTRLRKLITIKMKQFNAFDIDMNEAACTHHQKPLALNEEQEEAFCFIQKRLNKFGVFLLAGVTGSGKTEIYLKLVEKTLAEGKQVLLLVPEINLTPQMVDRLQQRLGKNKIALFHSKLTDLQRLKSWEAIKSNEKRIMIGTRSAIFTPFKNLGLIIIDEEHDSSFKQQGKLSYHARDVSIMRARFEKVPVVLGSATPSLESVHNTMYSHYHLLTLSKRAGKASLPKMQIIDLRNQHLKVGLSKQLLMLMQDHLKANNQVLLFLNRRGFSRIYLCHGCGWVLMCSACDSPLRLHMRPIRLLCHYCEKQVAVPSVCPHCAQDQLYAVGQGTQRLESFLRGYFEGVTVTRIDADSTRKKDQLSELLKSTQPDEPAILIGTQMLAKGHHFPYVTLSAIVDGDAGLFGTDFRSLEQAAQLIMQVGGRAGRASREGHVLIQTHHPDHPLLNQLIQKGYTAFSQIALNERKQSNWPPFSYLALLRIDSRHKQSGLDYLEILKANCLLTPAVSILGPVSTLVARRAGYYRGQLLFRSKERKALHSVLDGLVNQLQRFPKSGMRFHLDIDPVDVVN